MTKGLARSLSRAPALQATITKKAISLAGKTLTVDGATGVGFGSVVVEGLPEGNILLLGAVANVKASGPTSGDLVDTWNGDFALGTTPASDGTLTGGDVDIVASTAIGPAVAEVSPLTRGANGTPVMLDNTGGALEVNLNLLIDDADIGADGIVLSLDGSVHLAYITLGDD